MLNILNRFMNKPTYNPIFNEKQHNNLERFGKQFWDKGKDLNGTTWSNLKTYTMVVLRPEYEFDDSMVIRKTHYNLYIDGKDQGFKVHLKYVVYDDPFVRIKIRKKSTCTLSTEEILSMFDVYPNTDTNFLPLIDVVVSN